MTLRQICVTLLAAIGGISAAPRSDPQLSIADLTGKDLFEFGSDHDIDSRTYVPRGPLCYLITSGGEETRPFLLPIHLPIPIG